MALILKSKPVIDGMAVHIVPRVEEIKARGIEPTLAIVRVGKRPDDLSYERTAIKRATSLGIATRVFEMDEFVTQSELHSQIQCINQDASIHGCLLFRPLPDFMDEKQICDELHMQKDVDVSLLLPSVLCSLILRKVLLLVRQLLAKRFLITIKFLSKESMWWSWEEAW